ncbi:hypothetical protein VTP01DRAFT_1743 [Rhizomucor pusillus]|uniref:uncharacterized protein n=1 Tax=Rhizomucor pusillus TaxID=4840 RepID=UPI003743A2D7
MFRTSLSIDDSASGWNVDFGDHYLASTDLWSLRVQGPDIRGIQVFQDYRNYHCKLSKEHYDCLVEYHDGYYSNLCREGGDVDDGCTIVLNPVQKVSKVDFRYTEAKNALEI